MIIIDRIITYITGLHEVTETIVLFIHFCWVFMILFLLTYRRNEFVQRIWVKYIHILPQKDTAQRKGFAWFLTYTVHGKLDGLVQKRRNSSALIMELCFSCTKPSKWLRLCCIAYV